MYIVINQVTQTLPNPYYPGPGDMNPTYSDTFDQVQKFDTDEQMKKFIERNASDNANYIDWYQIYKAQLIKPKIKALIDLE